MAYDLEEQEQLAQIKAWWNRYGNLLTWLLIAAIAAYAGWTGGKNYQRRQTDQAAVLYLELQKAVEGKDLQKVQRAASDLQEKFASTTYAHMAALVAAKAAYDANELAAAKKQLTWASEHAKGTEYNAIATVRLAGVLLDEKAYDEALRMLSGSFPDHFGSIVADRKGDIMMAQGKATEAAVAYQLALEKMDPKNPGRQLVQIKLDAIGGVAKDASAGKS